MGQWDSQGGEWDMMRDTHGTFDLKALAKAVSKRDSERDTSWDSEKSAVPNAENRWDRPLSDTVKSTLPDVWSKGFQSLAKRERPAKVSERWWRTVQEDMYDFLQSDWALRALELGWTEYDLFGCHRGSPEARFDAMGLILVMNRKRLVALSEDSARLEAQSGQGILKHNRGTCCPQQERVMVWDLAK